MGQKERKALEVFFDDEARSVLYSLVDRDCPTQKTLNVADDIFEPTISSLFCLFNDLMIEHTPDLYQVEWISVACAIENTRSQYHRLLSDTNEARIRLVTSLEDIDSMNGEINNFELSKKLAGFDTIEICSILFHVQKYLVSKRRGEKYLFPEIEFKG